ncbi:unnamed protein product [Brachionus calyciflorus]|uniref:Centrosomal protein kizuna n=1 Tax=Brachionus calyciflorus TaxID=104777 RepID=A0A813MRP0_9BILA|nr:unnamed protein product [Brachionus calyciflorus]
MSQIDNLQQKIGFLENSNETMEKIAKSENDRLQLEIQLNRLINSDEAIAKTKAIKLKAYYQKLCNEEEKSLKRNQQLLQDLQNLDSQFTQLDSKLERLNNLKKECEVYIRTAYPVWTNDKKIFNTSESKQNVPRLDILTQINTLPKYDEKNQPLSALISSLKIETNRKYERQDPEEQNSALGELVKNLTKNTSGKISNTVIEQIPEKKDSDEYGGLNNLIGSFRPLTSTVKFEDDFQRTTTTMENNLLREYEKQLKRESNMLDTLNQTASASINFDMNIENIDTVNQFKTNSMSTQLINNLDELPKASSTGKDDISIKNYKIEDPNEVNRKGSVRQESSLDSFNYMLDYIELEIQHTIHPERYYRQEEPHYKTKLEIIRLASEKMSLDEMDPGDISMVIIEQLPQIVRKQTKNKCLFTTDLMSLSVADVSEQMVSLFLKEDSDIKFWNRIMKHMNFLKRYASIDISEIARKFAPNFLAFDSIAVEKAVKFLEKILNDANKNYENRNKTVVLEESLSKTETSLNNELLAASNSNLKESSAYQEFINSGQQSLKKGMNEKFSDDESDENDEINNLVSPKPLVSTNSTVNSNENNSTVKNNYLLKSPRKDYDFDFSQSSKTDSTFQGSIKQLNSLRSNKDKKQLPVYLKDGDSDDESSLFSDMSSKFRNKPKDSDSDFDFYK